MKPGALLLGGWLLDWFITLVVHTLLVTRRDAAARPSFGETEDTDEPPDAERSDAEELLWLRADERREPGSSVTLRFAVHDSDPR